LTTELDSYLTKTLEVSSSQGVLEIQPLAGDASSRRYSRIKAGNKSWVLMEWEPFEPENYSLLSIQRHFKKNHVLVPEVIASSGELGIILYEDLGDITLEQEFFKTRNPYGALGYYRMSVDELLKIHLQASQDRSPCVAFNLEFDVEKLSWEMNFTRTHFFEGILKYKYNSKELEKEFNQLTSILQNQPKVIQHRDYHSRNIMVFQNKVRVIDFQDARMGIVQYDLCSLLRDAYVPVPESLEKELLEYYIDRAQSDYNVEWSREQFNYLYEVQSIQRLFKAVGSFASFWMLRKDRRYLKYIPATLRRVKASLSLIKDFPILSAYLENSEAYDWNEDKL
jgi:aminoglycoside/choline kinase family phosphotransferase